MKRHVLTLCAWSFLSPIAALAQPDPNAPLHKHSDNLRHLVHAAHGYAQKHEGQLPPDLASLLPFVASEGESSAETVRNRFTAPGLPTPPLPDKITPAWVNEHSSYTYLGRPDLTLKDLPCWDDVAVLHLKLAQGLPSAGPNGPDDEFFAIALFNGGTVIMPRDAAEQFIEQSKQVIDAVATGGPLPESFEVMSDLRLIHTAAHAYAKAHNDELPPDLGALLAFIPDTKRTHTPRQKAGAFLPPRVEKNLNIPQDPTPEWINRHAGYVYLGAAGVKLTPIDFFEGPILAHARPEDTTKSPWGGTEDHIVIARVQGVERATPECLAWAVPYTKQVMAAAQGKGPWPDLAHALRDLKFIDKALKAYVDTHEGKLPPDLAALFDLLPPDAGTTPSDKARVFLSPRVERVSPPPDDANADWVRTHASYINLIPPDLTLKQVHRNGGPVHVLVHAPLNEEYSIVPCNLKEPSHVTPGLNWGWAWAFPPDYLKSEIEHSKQDIAELRTKNRSK